MYFPRDSYPYEANPCAEIASSQLRDGDYVYVQDGFGVVHVARDGPHQHPKILGGGKSVMYAGDLRIKRGLVVDLTNLSGTFRCDDPQGLIEVADQLLDQGLIMAPNSVRFFSADRSLKATILR